MRVALLCDVDQTVYHVGDEAIALASARLLEERGHEVIPVSRREKHGPGGRPPRESIRALTFPWPQQDRDRYLEEIREVLAGRTDALPAHDKLFEIIEQMRGIDALVIGGGGSLNSRYGWLLSERLAMAMVARSLGTPVVLSGQSLGPELSVADQRLIGELLDLCSLVGLRDGDSLALARTIRPEHPALLGCADDAVSLLGAEPAPLEHRISATIGADPAPIPREVHAPLVAAVLDALAERTGAPIELVPHMADPDAGGADESMLASVAALLKAPHSLAPLELAEASSRRTAASRFVVSTRFHPVVFGAVAGASVLALPLDRYGRSRMAGALANEGWSDAVVPLAALWTGRGAALGADQEEPIQPELGTILEQGVLDAVLDALLERADDEHAHLARVRPILLARSARWWDAIDAALRGDDAQAREAAAESVVIGESAGIAPRHPAQVRELLAPFVRPVGGAAAAEPAFSIITRTRDRGLLLDRAVQDALAQTRADWEMVVVNDAGDPAVVEEVLERWAHETRGRVRALHREVSTGMEAASNAGLAQSRGGLIAVHDDDDTWGAAFLQEAAAHLQHHPEELGVVVRQEMVIERIEGEAVIEEERHLSWPEMRDVTLLGLMPLNRFVPISLLYRRSAHDLVGEYDKSLPVVGDWQFHLRLLEAGRLGMHDRPLAQWRLRPAAVSAAGNSMFRKEDQHARYDTVVRERYFREWTDRNGLGLPLFIAKSTQESTDQIERRLGARIERLEEQVAQTNALLEEAVRLLEDGSEPSRESRAARAAQRVRSAAGRAARRALGRP